VHGGALASVIFAAIVAQSIGHKSSSLGT
jgi:hypothetical protein